VRWQGWLSRLSQLRVAVVRNEKLVAEVGNSSGTQRKGNVRRWKMLPSSEDRHWDTSLCDSDL
jgi:hypothetical protein